MDNRHFLAEGLAATSPRSSSTRCCASRTRPSSSRTSVGCDRRHDRAGAARGPGRRQVPRGHGRARRRCCARSTVPGAGDPGHRGPLPAARPGSSTSPSWTGGELLVLEGSGHLPMARDPVVVNRAIKGFVDRVTGAPAPARPRGARPKRRPRVLYLSSPIGLGHVRRDLAIADAMRERRPDLEVQWLTQSPVAEFLEQRGEVVHPASRLPGERVGALRVGVGRARPARVPGRPADGRGAGQQLHGLRRPGGAGGVRPLGGRRGLGPRPLPAREPRAQAGAVRLDDRLRRLGADARRRRAGGVPDRRLQRRDGRARGAVPRAARPVGVRRRPGRRGRPAAGAGPADGAGVDRGALRLRRVRDGGAARPGRPRRRCGTGSGTPTTRSSAWSASAVRASATTCCGAWSRRTTRRGAASPASGWWSSPARASTRARWARPRAWRCTASCPTSTCTTPRATWPSSRAG